MKRPLIWCCLSFTAGIYCYAYAAKQLLFCGILFALLSFCLYLLKKSPAFFLIFLFFLGGAFDCRHWQTVTLNKPTSLHQTEAVFEGTVSDLPREGTDGIFSYRISLTSLNEEPCRLTLWLTSREQLDPGEVISGTGTLRSSRAMQKEGESFGDYLVRQGYSLSCSFPELTRLPASRWNSLRYFPLRLRAQMISQLRRYVSAPWRGILIAVSTGDRSDLTSVQKNMFAQTGTSHIISVSGLHVSILLMIMIALLEFLRMPYPASRILCLPLPLFLALFMGGQASVLRACIMGFLFLLAECVQAESDSMNSLFLAAFLILLFRPDSLFQAGFQLSFSATFGILAFSHVFSQATAAMIPGQEVRALLSTSVSSYLTTLWEVLYFYHQLPSISMIANLFLVPLFPILLISIFLFAVMAAVFPAGAPVGAKLLEGMSALLFGPLELLSKAPVFQLATPNRFFIAGYCFLIVFLYFLSRKRKSVLLFLGVAVCLGAGCFQQYRLSQYDSMTAVSAGSIDNIIVQTTEGTTLLLAGVTEDASSFSYDYQTLLNYFQKNNIKTIDVFSFMNYNKNTAALFRALGQDRTITFVLLPPGEDLTPELARIAEQNNVRKTDFTQPLFIPLSETKGCAFSPDGTFVWYQNESLVAQVGSHPGKEAVLTKQTGRREITADGQSYPERYFGTLRFLLKNGSLQKVISENTYE